MVDRNTEKAVPHYRRVKNDKHQIDVNCNCGLDEDESEGFLSRMKNNLSPFNRDKMYQNSSAVKVDDSSYLSLSELLVSTNDDPDGDGDGGVVRSVRVWDVKIPPVGKKIVAGKLVPTMKSLGTRWMKRPRRLSIEIYSTLSQTMLKEGREEEESLAGGPVKAANRHVMEGLLRGESFSDHEKEELRDGENVYIRVLKPCTGEQESDGSSKNGNSGGSSNNNIDHNEDTNVEDSFSVSTLGDCCGADEQYDQQQWTEHRRCTIDGFEILKVHRNTMEVRIGIGQSIEIQTIAFKSVNELLSFQQVAVNLSKLERRRARRQLKSFKRKEPPRVLEIIREDEKKDESTHIKIIVEICSATNLPFADVRSKTSNPYCKVYMGANEIHKTKHIPETLDPIWTVSTGCFVLISCCPEDFFGTTRGFNFIMKHHGIGPKSILGKLKILPKNMLEAATGERIEYDLFVKENQENQNQPIKKPKLALRIRHATENDLEFMNFLRSNRKKRKEIRLSDLSGFVSPKATGTHILRKTRIKNKNGQILYRVKPRPDPERVEKTEFLTKEQISFESLQPSQNWIEAGSGLLGQLFFEIIGCDGLPNKDKAILGAKTDAFATVVFEDSVVNSEVINNSLSPRFMPWTQRAFVFNIEHPSSEVFVAISDFDLENSVIAHDPIGRVAIDITNLKANTNYLLNYDLYTSTVATRGHNEGKMTVRIRIEWNSERGPIFAALKNPIPKQQFVNFEKSFDFHTAYFACHGRDDVNKFDLDILTSYVEELLEYKNVHYHIDIKYVVLHIILWRGHYPIKFRDFVFRQKTVLIPLHSIYFFLACACLVENCNYLPSFILFTIAWLFLAMLEFRKKHPSPWSDSKSYLELFSCIITGKSVAQTIETDENIHEVEEYNKQIREKIEKRQRLSARDEKQQAYFEGLATKGDTALDTEVIEFNPLKPILFPAQQYLALTLRALRKIKAIVVWDDSYEAFWITTICIALGAIFLSVPWNFLIYWTLKIAVWTLLGPWMKLVDIFYYRNLENTPKDQQYKGSRMNWRKQWSKRVAQATEARIMNENALKLRDIRKVVFGKHALCVPRSKDARHIDRPLTSSSAQPCEGLCNINIIEKIQGQELHGVIIPTR